MIKRVLERTLCRARGCAVDSWTPATDAHGASARAQAHGAEARANARFGDLLFSEIRRVAPAAERAVLYE
jgi:hypothetical protein